MGFGDEVVLASDPNEEEVGLVLFSGILAAVRFDSFPFVYTFGAVCAWSDHCTS